VPNALILEGELKKRSPKGLQRFQTRYFMLFSDCLRYYKDKRAADEPLGAIPLHAVRSVCHVADKPKRFDIHIGEGASARTFVLAGASMMEATKWVNVVKSTLVKYNAKRGAAIKHAHASGVTALLDTLQKTTATDEKGFWKKKDHLKRDNEKMDEVVMLEMAELRAGMGGVAVEENGCT
jgi:hypothetical protein